MATVTTPESRCRWPWTARPVGETRDKSPYAACPSRGAEMVPTLHDLRVSRLWSQRELARRAGVSHVTVVTAETGRRRPLFESVRRLSAALGVSPLEVEEFRQALGLPVEETQ